MNGLGRDDATPGAGAEGANPEEVVRLAYIFLLGAPHKVLECILC